MFIFECKHLWPLMVPIPSLPPLGNVKRWRESKEAWKPMGSPKSVSIALMCHHTLDLHLRLLHSHDPSGLPLRSLTLFCNLWFQLERTLTLQRKNRGYNKKETLWRNYGARKRYGSGFRMNSVFSMCNFLKEVVFLIICTEIKSAPVVLTASFH